MIDPKSCEHANVRATVVVVKYEEYNRRTAEIVIRCEDCGVPFCWHGVAGGLSPSEPRVGVAAVQLRVPISPALDIPAEHWRMLLEESFDS